MNPISPLKSLKSLVPRGGVEPPTHGFSGVADTADFNDLADGGWQKPGAIVYRRVVPTRAQIHALRTLIEYREQAGPRVYIAKDLDAALRALLAHLEQLS